MIVAFGDIFAFGESKYVYLSESNGVLYAAKIIPPSTVEEIESRRTLNAANPSRKFNNQHVAYCFVRLTTEPFRDHGAHLGKTDDPAVNNPFNVIGALNSDDSNALIDVILNGESSRGVPNEVKDVARELKGDGR